MGAALDAPILHVATNKYYGDRMEAKEIGKTDDHPETPDEILLISNSETNLFMSLFK
jgi:hypothetical protein